MTSPSLLAIREALQWAVVQLQRTTDRPHNEAERLLAWILHLERTAVLAHPEWPLAPAQVDRFTDAVQRRATGVPLPYILGFVEFFGLEFGVTPAVLIPRPETELLVELALPRLSAWHHSGVQRAQRVVDVGTGSGCIAVALAAAVPSSRIWAADISAAALAVARANAQRNSVAERLAWVQTDLLTPFAAPVDLIVSNPPYIAEAEWQDLPCSVRHEPRAALISGPEGLDAIERLLRQAATRLAPGGCLLTEIGEQQASAVMELAQRIFTRRGHQATHLQIHQDLEGRDRVLEVSLAGPTYHPGLE
ncbi:MAG: peptide chain release factor N(5)-glutamine methyltransferase [Anaerolineae bacterium]|nr:peptide chain release factor N(5)-glutamine methyltransferase [Anaerolineae bacterium]